MLMHLLSKIYRELEYLKFHYYRRKAEWKNLKDKKFLYKKIILTSEQKKKIDDFYLKNYGKKIPHYWHRLYQSYTGNFSEKYIPELLCSPELEYILNPKKYSYALSDKNLCNLICSGVNGVRCPKTYLGCIRGIFRSGENQIINKEQAISILNNIGDCVIKKSVDSCSGRDVLFCHFINGIDIVSKKTIEDIFSLMGNNFIAQEKIRQWHELDTLCSTSLNTFRVISYIINDSIQTCPIALRMGRFGCDRDNICYGGIGIGVTDDGYLMPNAYSKLQDVYPKHPDSGVVFKGYHIQHVDKILTVAKQLHAQIPQVQIVHWDLTLNESGTPVLIEINLDWGGYWLPQMDNGKPLFGDNTDKILQLMKKRRETHKFQE